MRLNTYIVRLDCLFKPDIGDWLPKNYSKQFSSTISFNGTFNIILAFCPRVLFSSDTKLTPSTSVLGLNTTYDFCRFSSSLSTLGTFSWHLHRVRALKISIKLRVMTSLHNELTRMNELYFHAFWCLDSENRHNS